MAWGSEGARLHQPRGRAEGSSFDAAFLPTGRDGDRVPRTRARPLAQSHRICAEEFAGADHFIDLERVSWLDPLPPSRYEFYRKLYEKRAATSDHPDDYLPEGVGLQPSITMEVYGRLKAAFRECSQLRAAYKPTSAVQQAIIFYAGWLGHYVADGLHALRTTINYNGWMGENPKGYTTEHHIHAQFESIYVAANITPKDFAALVKTPEKLGDPFAT
jgi:hypothetical protein